MSAEPPSPMTPDVDIDGPNVLPDNASHTPTLHDEEGASQKPYDTGDGKLHTTTSNEKDILIVDWDGPNDPTNPKNWSHRGKWGASVIVSLFTFISPVSSSIIAPAAFQVADEFGVKSDILISIMTSVFVLGYAFGPFLLGPLSEIYGRSRVLQLANAWYLGWNLACGFAKSEAQFIAFRFLAGLGGSAPMAVGGGVLGDIWRPEERGKAIAVFSLAPLLGPVVGPVTGAWIAERSTWKWVFYATSIADAIVQLLGMFFLKETYAPVLLEWKAVELRKTMDTEKGPYREVRTVFDGDARNWKTIMSNALKRPFQLFFNEPIVVLLSIYMAYLYGILYRKVFTGESVGIAGLHYIALGVGLMLASQVNAKSMDKIYVYFKNKNGGVGKPEFRLPAMFPGSLLLPMGMLIGGWCVEKRTLWIGPDVGSVLVGAGIVLNFQCIPNLHPLAAANCLRSLAGFGFPLFAPSIPWIFWRYGERIRNNSRYAFRTL
ncbi:MFS polyamine transporter [Suillus paluster]|uniref:MFS polyamine transporter n=1 Tax=Suillus paluster TaxID=48578 RepID=UPI001B85B516|nr:MFS polyamine transporter [Suillus paluster]KAG1739085.1 MFS polyamine transporter [Suillus paluster]